MTEEKENQPKHTGRIIFMIVAGLIFWWALAQPDPRRAPQPKQPMETEPIPPVSAGAQEAALKDLRKEPQIKDLYWSEDTRTLRVSVMDDGSSQDGYAQYVCLVLVNHGASRGMNVRIVEGEAMAGGGRTLGSARCPDGGPPEPFEP